MGLHVSQLSDVKTQSRLYGLFCYIRVIYALTVAVARSSSGDNAVRFVLPVLWMTSRLSVVGQANATPTGRIVKMTHHGRSLMPLIVL